MHSAQAWARTIFEGHYPSDICLIVLAIFPTWRIEPTGGTLQPKENYSVRPVPITASEVLAKLPKIPHWLLKQVPAELRRQGISRVLVHYLGRLGIPDYLTRDALYYGRVAAHPVRIMRRRAHPKSELRVPRDKGWLRVPDSYLDGTADLVAHCNALFQRNADHWRANWRPPFSMVIRFGLNADGRPCVENPDDLAPVIRFCAQPKLYDLVAEYIGQHPVLCNLSLAYTGATNERIGSQLFHRDMGRDQLHLVIPIWPIDEDGGPFTLLPADESARVIEAISHSGGRVSDEVMFSHASRDRLVRLTGKPGDAFLVNPLRCFHYGARAQTKPRLMLIANFTSAFDAGSDAAVYRCTNRHLLDDGNWRTRMLLDL